MALYLSREETIANHRKMWNWIADETLKRKRRVLKEEYFEENHIPKTDRPDWECYCCVYSRIIMVKEYPTCYESCPLIWGDGITTCLNFLDKEFNVLNRNAGLYAKWMVSDNYQETAELARQIANLPEREVKENEN